MVSVYVTVTECHFHSHHKGTNAKKKKDPCKIELNIEM